MKTNKDAALLVGLVLAGLSIVVSWGCNLTSSCTFGKYRAQVTLRSAETQQPLADANVRTRIFFGANPFLGEGRSYYTKTDAQGQANVEFANVEFDRSSSSPLSIHVSARPRGSQVGFSIDSDEIRARTTISQSQPVRIVGGGQKDVISLTLEINGWSLF